MATSGLPPSAPALRASRGVAETVDAIRNGALDAGTRLRESLDAIAAREQDVGAWTERDVAEAQAKADELDVARAHSSDAANHRLLHGVPIGVKDIIDVAGMITACNSPIYAAHRASSDATIVARARAAGAVVLGKTTTQEFATRGNMPSTRNPHSALHTPGGSSSGSAAAVAAGMVPLALSTQTAGSIVRPASYCGIVGFKPSFDWMPLAGVKTIAPSLDTLGLHAGCVRDAAIAWAALSADDTTGSGQDSDARSGQLSELDALCGVPLTAGVVRAPYWHLAQPETRQALEFAAQVLRSAGIRVVEQDLPKDFDQLGTALDTISDHEACASLAHEWQNHRALLSEGVQRKIERGLALPDATVQRAYDLARVARSRSAELFSKCDFVLTPSSPGYSPLISAGDPGDSSFSKLWTILGSPSLSIPVPASAPLPIGLQIVCDAGQDYRALQCARAIEAIFSAWAAKR